MSMLREKQVNNKAQNQDHQGGKKAEFVPVFFVYEGPFVHN